MPADRASDPRRSVQRDTGGLGSPGIPQRGGLRREEAARGTADQGAGRVDEARRIHFALSPLFTALFYETNPIPVKTALGMMGKIDPELRLPLCAMAAETKDQLTRVLKDAGLI